MVFNQFRKFRQSIRYTGEDIFETGICALIVGVAVPIRMIPEFLDNQTAFTIVTFGAIASFTVAIPIAIPLIATGLVLQKIGCDEIS